MRIVTSPKAPPITLEIATSTVPTALPLAAVGALCTASCSVTLCVVTLWRIRNSWNLLKYDGRRVHNASACTTSGGVTLRAGGAGEAAVGGGRVRVGGQRGPGRRFVAGRRPIRPAGRGKPHPGEAPAEK